MPIPSDFGQRILRIRYVEARNLLRIFKTPVGHPPEPLYYNQNATFRFDCPATAGPGSNFGVTYAADKLLTCFAETVTRDANQHPWLAGGIAVSESAQIRPRYVAKLSASMPLKLADTTDLGLYGLGAESSEFNSPNYPNHTQPWALEIFRRVESVHGLIYRSRFLNGQEAVAIFDRGGKYVSLMAAEVVPLAEHPDFPRVLETLRISLLP